MCLSVLLLFVIFEYYMFTLFVAAFVTGELLLMHEINY